MLEVSRDHFVWKAIWADFRQSRRWQIVTVAYTVIGLCFFAMRFVTTWTPAQLLASWGGKSKIILILAFLCIGLILLLIAVVDGACRIHLQAVAPLRLTIENEEWLVDLAERDRQDVGKGVAITECDVRLDLECSKAYAEFTFYFFNGSVYPISIQMDLGGQVIFSDGADTRKLEQRPDRIRKRSFKDTREDHGRYVSGHFVIVQELSAAEVEFVSTKRSAWSGFFIFDELVITVKGYGENMERARLPTGHVRPKLRCAFREDASAIESKHQTELSKIYNLEIVRGMALQLWHQLRNTGNAIPRNVFDKWKENTLHYLTENYGKKSVEELYGADFSRRAISRFSSFPKGLV
jgi:hypothetical protein